jgi:hypothetical protein
MYWIAGLSGLVFGTLVINQGFFETYFDIQILVFLQGAALVALGGSMFLVAIGMMSGARWGIDVAKRVAGFSIGWSAIGIPLAVWTAYNVSGLESLILYGVVAWLLAFALSTGLIGLRYLYSEGITVRKYAEYVTTEPLSRQQRLLPSRVAVRRPSQARGNPRLCLDCGSAVPQGASVCPTCGAPQ